MTTTITVQCPASLLALLEPIEVSKGIPSAGGFETRHAAVYDLGDLMSIPEDRLNAAKAWWREMGWCNTHIAWDPARIKDEGIWGYLCDEYGISTERNTSVAFNELAFQADMSEIELFNWLAENGAAR
jgi:hypothetical protein